MEDVAVLCPRFAVLRAGELVTVATPEDAIATLDGHLFEGPADEGATQDPAFVTTRTLLTSGKRRARLYRVAAGAAPPATYAPVTPSLEDVFFLVVRGDLHLGARAGSRAAA